MLRYTTDRARPGLVALYDIRRGNGAGQFLQPRSPHGAERDSKYRIIPHAIGDMLNVRLTTEVDGTRPTRPKKEKVVLGVTGPRTT